MPQADARDMPSECGLGSRKSREERVPRPCRGKDLSLPPLKQRKLRPRTARHACAMNLKGSFRCGSTRRTGPASSPVGTPGALAELQDGRRRSTLLLIQRGRDMTLRLAFPLLMVTVIGGQI